MAQITRGARAYTYICIIHVYCSWIIGRPKAYSLTAGRNRNRHQAREAPRCAADCRRGPYPRLQHHRQEQHCTVLCTRPPQFHDVSAQKKINPRQAKRTTGCPHAVLVVVVLEKEGWIWRGNFSTEM